MHPFIHALVAQLGIQEKVLFDWLMERSSSKDDLGLGLVLFFFLQHQSKSQVSMSLSEQSFALQLSEWSAKLGVEFPLSAQELSQLDWGLYHRIMGTPEQKQALVIFEGALYFSRLFHSEQCLVDLLPQWLQRPARKVGADYAELLTEVIQGNRLHARQAAAVALAPLAPFFVISGGPGTGKTTVLVHVLRTWLRLDPSRRPEQIVLCAPTGKAKARMSESLKAGLQRARRPEAPHPVDEMLAQRSPEAMTLHQLLWKNLNSTGGPLQKIPHSLVVVDEVSMVDLRMFRILMQSLGEGSQLLLLGDMYQLPSVDHGAVLGDLTLSFAQDQKSLSPECVDGLQGFLQGVSDLDEVEELGQMQCPRPLLLRDHVVQLSKSYRSLRGILNFAQAVLHCAPGESLPATPGGSEIHLQSLQESEYEPFVKQWFDRELCAYVHGLQALAKMDLSEVLSSGLLQGENGLFELQNRSRVLCLQRQGTGGVEQVNRLGRQWLASQWKNTPFAGSRQNWFHGEPVMMSQNHHALELYNGDSGMVVQLGSKFYVLFPHAQGFRAFGPEELQGLSSAFAITVHKSQGSEYLHPLLLIPPAPSHLESKEILYTALTRAKAEITLAGVVDQERLSQIAQKALDRPSRLRSLMLA